MNCAPIFTCRLSRFDQPPLDVLVAVARTGVLQGDGVSTENQAVPVTIESRERPRLAIIAHASVPPFHPFRPASHHGDLARGC